MARLLVILALIAVIAVSLRAILGHFSRRGGRDRLEAPAPRRRTDMTDAPEESRLMPRNTLSWMGFLVLIVMIAVVSVNAMGPGAAG